VAKVKATPKASPQELILGQSLESDLQAASAALRSVVDNWRKASKEGPVALESMAAQRALREAQVIQGQSAHLVSALQRIVNRWAIQ